MLLYLKLVVARPLLLLLLLLLILLLLLLLLHPPPSSFLFSKLPSVPGADPGFLTRGFKWLKGGFVLVLLP